MVQSATANNYPYGQCTWWACERFHQLTGIYVSFAANANGWSTLATANGYTVTSTPVNGPQIICLQAFVQGAGMLGHVAYVESVQNANTVVSSNMNWGDTTAERLSVQSVTFHTGTGVTFISLPGSTAIQTGGDVATSATAQIGLIQNISSIGSFFTSYPVLLGWIGEPVRIAKLFAGIALIFIGFLALIAPDVIKTGVKVAKDATKLTEVAAL